MNERQEIKAGETVVLKKIIPEDSAAIFALIDRDRAHLSQFGDQTAAKYPTLDSVREKNSNQAPDEYRFGIWDKDVFVGFIKVTQREVNEWR